MPRVVNFEVLAVDPERAMRFYRQVFHWVFTEWDGPETHWHVRTGPDDEPGINGGLTVRTCPGNGRNATSWICTVEVDALDDYVERVETAGGKIVVPRFSIAGIGWMAQAKDTEGNVFALIEKNPDAT